MEKTKEDIKLEVKSIFNSYTLAWKNKDLKAFEKIFLNSNDLVIIDSHNSFNGWESVKKWLKDLLNDNLEIRIQIEDESITIHKSKQLVWISAIENIKWITNEKYKIGKEINISWILELIDDNWTIVQGHWSSPKHQEHGFIDDIQEIDLIDVEIPEGGIHQMPHPCLP